jgi:hypothetical protein
MAIANTRTIGLTEQFIQFLNDNKANLQAKGLDVTNWITDTGSKKTDAVTQIGKQDEMEAATKAQTKVMQTSVKDLYDTVSTRIDAAIGVLGKKTPEAKQLASLRSSLIKQYKKPKEELKKS